MNKPQQVIEVRTATIEDCINIAILGRHLWEELEYSKQVGYDRDSVLETCLQLADEDTPGVLLVAIVGGTIAGFISGIVSPIFFNKKHSMLTELFWWVDKDHRKTGLGFTLLQKFEDAGKAAGADFVVASMGEKACTGKAGELIAKCGYTPAERSYIKGT